MALSTTHARILAIVRRIPRGRVATYGQVAALAGYPRQPRLAGYALRHAEEAVPWQRVVNAGGRISARADSESARVQQILLRREGIRFNAKGRLDLERYRWRPRTGHMPPTLDGGVIPRIRR